uniref:Putative ovule protein n=1 Tax=Solanum chacoense TaxID=4108 RepID=A0A0V0I7L6_SOLCH
MLLYGSQDQLITNTSTPLPSSFTMAHLSLILLSLVNTFWGSSFNNKVPSSPLFSIQCTGYMFLSTYSAY